MNIADVAMILEKHALSSHFYADDVELYLSCHCAHTALSDSRVSASIDDITVDGLKLLDGKSGQDRCSMVLDMSTAT